jgi:hypothetical protein
MKFSCIRQSSGPETTRQFPFVRLKQVGIVDWASAGMATHTRDNARGEHSATALHALIGHPLLELVTARQTPRSQVDVMLHAARLCAFRSLRKSAVSL